MAAQSSGYANLPFWSFFEFITEYWPTFTRNKSLKKPFSLSCTRDFSPFFSIAEIFISLRSSWAKFLQTFIGICLSGGLYRRIFNNLLPYTKCFDFLSKFAKILENISVDLLTIRLDLLNLRRDLLSHSRGLSKPC